MRLRRYARQRGRGRTLRVRYGDLELGEVPLRLDGEARCLAGQCTLCGLDITGEPAGCSDSGTPLAKEGGADGGVGTAASRKQATGLGSQNRRFRRRRGDDRRGIAVHRFRTGPLGPHLRQR